MTELTDELKLKFQNSSQAQLNNTFVKACNNGDLEVIHYLLTSPELMHHADIHVEDDLCLVAAAIKGHLDVIKYLLISPELTWHANIHAQDDAAFKLACLYHKLDVVQYLLTFSGENYIDFQKTHSNLDGAISEKYHDIVKAMMKSLYKNDMMAYLENISKVERYFQKHNLDFQEWQEEILKDDIVVNPNEEKLFL